MNLTLVDLHTVIAPRVVAELDNTFLGLDRYFCHLVRAIDIALQTIEGIAIIQTDTSEL